MVLPGGGTTAASAAAGGAGASSAAAGAPNEGVQVEADALNEKGLALGFIAPNTEPIVMLF